MDSLGILFVCTHNLCRSPMAEAAMRAKAKRAGMADRLAIASAGTSAMHAGQRVDSRAVAVTQRRGYEIGSRKARKVEARDFGRYAYVLAMDERNLQALAAIRPEDYQGRLDLALAFAPRCAQREVPDPYYGSLATFEHALDLIELACDGVLRELR